MNAWTWFLLVLVVVTVIFGTKQDRNYLAWAFGAIVVVAGVGLAIAVSA